VPTLSAAVFVGLEPGRFPKMALAIIQNSWRYMDYWYLQVHSVLFVAVFFSSFSKEHGRMLSMFVPVCWDPVLNSVLDEHPTTPWYLGRIRNIFLSIINFYIFKNV
jgi:hypothetical protein